MESNIQNQTNTENKNVPIGEGGGPPTIPGTGGPKLDTKKIIWVIVGIAVLIVLFMVYSGLKKAPFLPLSPNRPPEFTPELDSLQSNDAGPVMDLGADATSDIQKDLDDTIILDPEEEFKIIDPDLEQL